VNGIRACARKGFVEWLRRSGATIVALQEVRARADELPQSVRRLRAWQSAFTPAQRRGYSGVGLLARRAIDELHTATGEERFDVEGRMQLARFGRLLVANVYFPKGSGRNRDNSRVPYKLDFYRRVFEHVQRGRERGLRVLVAGDFNTAHQAIDLARPKANVETSGFLPEERAELDRWIAAGWVDAFRHFEPGPGHYTWWSQRTGCRARNIGWRIDYVLACPRALPFIRRAFILPHVLGSDHCPVGVDLDPAVCLEPIPEPRTEEFASDGVSFGRPGRSEPQA
jgi:exodeoxyribonuclease-3